MADKDGLSKVASDDYKELKDALAKVDLNFDYWFPHFQTNGLERVSQLQNAGKHEFKQLCKEKRLPWEEQSLRKLLKPNIFEMFSNKDWRKEDIVSVAHFLRQEVLPLMGVLQPITFSERNKDFADLMTKITADLKTEGKLWDHIIFKLGLLCEQYNDESHRFDKILHTEDVNRLIHNLMAFNNEVKRIRDNSSSESYQTQAALLRFVIQNSNFVHQSKRKVFFDEVIDSINILEPIKQVIDRFKNVKVWEELEIDCCQLAEGKEVHVEKSGIDILLHILQNNPNHQVLSRVGVENDPNKCNQEPMEQQNTVNNILSEMGLLKYFPNKIDLRTAIKKDLQSDAITENPEKIAWSFIRNLVTLNPEEVRKVVNVGDTASVAPLEDDLMKSFFLNSNHDSSDSLHPTDILLAVLMCCDDPLRKLLYQKLYLCKFAFPVITRLQSGSLLVHMWALRSIMVEYYDIERHFQEGSCVDVPVDIVSTFSLGQTEQEDSNVKLLNGIITENKHNVFFHRDCLTNASKQNIDGFIEGTLAMPTDKTSFLNKLTWFCNLSGNIERYKSLLDLCVSMSNVVIILLDFQDLVEAAVVHTLLDVGQKLILVLKNSSQMKMRQMSEILNKFSTEYETRKGGTLCVVNGIDTPEQELWKLLRERIFTKLEGNHDHKKSFQVVMSEKCKQFSLLTDEDQSSCKDGKLLADICQADFNDSDFEKGRNRCLPLHGKEWHMYSTYLKEERRFVQSEEESALGVQENIKRKQLEQRNCQKQMLKESLSHSKHFLTIMANGNVDLAIMNSFFHWLKLKLDMKSLAFLPDQHAKCKEAWQKYRNAKDDKNTERDIVRQLFNHVKRCDEELSNGVIGLEHLFREVGQTYEAAMFGCENPDIKCAIKTLPIAMAKLFLNGNTIELLDGDAANAPLQWLEAVFNQLQMLIGDKKIFVVSILGVQSSGKSTLLNTMFGLQFPVSAGRCTKGIYAQLLPLENRKYDYILVLDTEGLRAPELALDMSSCARDNELATLAIGMADLTIVNIKGENTEEMRNCLQIAMHAFVRMKMTAKKIKDKQRCIFVHINVSATSAKDKLRSARQKLEEVLDRLFEEAAKQEKCKDVVSFRDVLHFDGDKDVWFLSDLWHGDPPLAPVNPGYAQQVAKVKQCIIDMGDSLNHLQSIWDCFGSFKDLWDAILEEDFIFSFRNSFEVKAYQTILKEYLAIRRSVNNNITDWLEKEPQILIKLCDSTDDLTEARWNSCDLLKEKLLEEEKTAKEKLLKCFEQEDIKETAIQWKQSKLIELAEHCKLMHSNAKQTIEEFCHERHMGIINDNQLDEFKAKMQTDAIRVAETLKSDTITDVQIKEEFEKQWNKWQRDMPSSDKRTEVVNIQREMRDALDDLFQTDHSLVKDLLVNSSIDEHDRNPNISLTEAINSGYIISKKRKYNVIGYLEISKDSGLFVSIRKFFQKADKKLDKWRNVFQDGGHETVHKFKRKHIDDLIFMMHDDIVRHNEKQSALELNRSQEIKLVLLLCQIAFPVFSERQKLFEERFSISTQLNQLKEMLFNFFKNALRKSESELTAADMICDTIKHPLSEYLVRTMSDEIVKTTISHIGNKQEFLVRIMTYLLREKSFHLYANYIEDPCSLGEDYIVSHIQNLWLDKVDGHRSTKYKTRFIVLLRTKCKRLNEMIVRNEDTMITGRRLSTKFIKEMRTIIPGATNLFRSFKCPSIGDRRHLRDFLVTGIQRIETELRERVRTPKYTPETYVQEVMREVWGCRALCPFCREPCKDSNTSNHTHSCIQHRPEGIMGQYWIKSNELILHPCTFNIATGSKFLCTKRCHSDAKPEKLERRRHKYKDYKTYFTKWNIRASTDPTISNYWRFVMVKYIKDFANYHERNIPEIPNSWQNLSEEEALHSLKTFQ